MKREEIVNSREYQVAKAAVESYKNCSMFPNGYINGFENGAEWDREELIKKAVEWLKEQDEIIGISFQEDFINRFKKYMEE